MNMSDPEADLEPGAKLNHIAIAVPDLEAAAAMYKDVLGAVISDPVPQPDHGVTIMFATLANVRIELMTPLGANSPISGFLQRHEKGGLHHLCFSTENMDQTKSLLKDKNMRLLGEGTAKPGATGKDVIFVHPADFCGTLVEFEEG